MRQKHNFPPSQLALFMHTSQTENIFSFKVGHICKVKKWWGNEISRRFRMSVCFQVYEMSKGELTTGEVPLVYFETACLLPPRSHTHCFLNISQFNYTISCSKITTKHTHDYRWKILYLQKTEMIFFFLNSCGLECVKE